MINDIIPITIGHKSGKFQEDSIKLIIKEKQCAFTFGE